MNQWELQKYQLTANSRGQVVRMVKQLLHWNLCNSYRMDGTDVFDAKIQSAIAEFQRAARLPNTSGILDAQTWAAMGANMLPAQISILSIHDSNIGSLLSGNLGGGRGLSADEIKLAQIMYKTSIDYTKVKFHKEKYISQQPDTTFMTPNGEIYAPPKIYSSDYAFEANEFKATIIHEFCHVWQWQRNIKYVRTSAVLEGIWHWGDYDEAYYYKLEEYKDLKEFGLEQQAVMIEDYYRVVKLNLDYSESPTGKKRVLNYPNDSLVRIKNLLTKALSKFLANPSY